MIVLHGAIHQDRLLVWGETRVEANGAASTAKRKTRRARRKAGSPKRLIFDVGTERLRKAFYGARLGLAERSVPADSVTAWLPTQKDQPVASTSLIAEPPASRAKPRIAPWTVSALTPNTADAIEFLCACLDRQTLGPGVIVGRDLAFCARAMRLAGALVANQRFLPSVVEHGPESRAVWEPVFEADDGQRLQGLARAMPAAVWAVGAVAAAEPPQRAAENVLRGFVGQIVDCLVRRSIASPSRATRRVASFDSAHDQWLAALRSVDGHLRPKRPGGKRRSARRGSAGERAKRGLAERIGRRGSPVASSALGNRLIAVSALLSTRRTAAFG